jgi:hypothetical protein
MGLKPIKRVPSDESGRHLTDGEMRKKLNELIDFSTAQLEENVYLRGQITLLTSQVTAIRRAQSS